MLVSISICYLPLKTISIYFYLLQNRPDRLFHSAYIGHINCPGPVNTLKIDEERSSPLEQAGMDGFQPAQKRWDRQSTVDIPPRYANSACGLSGQG